MSAAVLLPHGANVTDALLQWRSRRVLTTALSSAELRDVASEVRQRAVFSARVTSGEFLNRVAEL